MSPVSSIRDNVQMEPTKPFFQLSFCKDIEIYCYDAKNSRFAQLSPYVTLSSPATNGVFKIKNEGSHSLLSYEGSKFITFSVYFVIMSAENEPVLSLRAITSREHGLILFKSNHPMLANNRIPREMTKNTVLYLGIDTKLDKFTIDVCCNGEPNSSIQWTNESGWNIPDELDGDRIAVKVSINALNISELFSCNVLQCIEF